MNEHSDASTPPSRDAGLETGQSLNADAPGIDPRLNNLINFVKGMEAVGRPRNMDAIVWAIALLGIGIIAAGVSGSFGDALSTSEYIVTVVAGLILTLTGGVAYAVYSVARLRGANQTAQEVVRKYPFRPQTFDAFGERPDVSRE